jgi:hypothetical protein
MYVLVSWEQCTSSPMASRWLIRHRRIFARRALAVGGPSVNVRSEDLAPGLVAVELGQLVAEPGQRA